MRALRLLPLALAAAACATSALPADPVESARSANEEAVATLAAAIDAPANARRWIVLEAGEVRAAASLPDDAVRAAAARFPRVTPHRFVFRPADRGERLHRMAYVADGGIVAGRRFASDLGLEIRASPGGTVVLRRRGARTGGIEVGGGRRVPIEVSSLDGAASRRLDAVVDPDFDGGLLVPREVAAEFALERFEVPGLADVQVAMGRPFRAHRATVLARVAELAASGPAEALFETRRLVGR